MPSKTLRVHVGSVDLRIHPALLVVVALTLSASGCSYLFVNGPPESHEGMNYFSCTESNTGPILDALWAGLNLAGTAVIVADPDDYERNYDLSSGAGVASGVGWTILSGSASIVGFNKTKDCREAKRALAERQFEQREGNDTLQTQYELPR